MYANGARKGLVRFAMKPPRSAKAVELAGSFNGWKALAMRKQKDGEFSVTVNVRPGTHEYKFVVDGQWVVDPDNPSWAMNPYGTFNSVADVH